MDDKFKALKTVDDLSMLNGHAFEEYLTQLFTDLGYKATKTPGSGDYGIDVVLDAPNERIVVQAKQYSSDVGFDAVKEAHFGMSFYEADAAWVVCTGDFTKQAVTAATTTGVKLVDAKELQRYIDLALSGGNLVNDAGGDIDNWERYEKCTKVVGLTRHKVWRDIDWAYSGEEARLLKSFVAACIAAVMYRLQEDSQDCWDNRGNLCRFNVEGIIEYVPFDFDGAGFDAAGMVEKVRSCNGDSVFWEVGEPQHFGWVVRLTRLEARMARAEDVDLTDYVFLAAANFRTYRDGIDEAFRLEQERIDALTEYEKLREVDHPELPRIGELQQISDSKQTELKSLKEIEKATQEHLAAANRLKVLIAEMEDGAHLLEGEIASLTGMFKNKARKAKTEEHAAVLSEIKAKQSELEEITMRIADGERALDALPDAEADYANAVSAVNEAIHAAACDIQIENRYKGLIDYLQSADMENDAAAIVCFSDKPIFSDGVYVCEESIRERYEQAKLLWLSLVPLPCGRIDLDRYCDDSVIRLLDDLGLIDIEHTDEGDAYFAFGQPLNTDVSYCEPWSPGNVFMRAWRDSRFTVSDVSNTLNIPLEDASTICKNMVKCGEWVRNISNENGVEYAASPARAFLDAWEGEDFQAVDVKIVSGLETAAEAVAICDRMVDLGRWEIIPSVEPVKVYRPRKAGSLDISYFTISDLSSELGVTADCATRICRHMSDLGLWWNEATYRNESGLEPVPDDDCCYGIRNSSYCQLDLP